jgi:hypothetical protein
MPQLGASLTIVILTTLEMSFMLLETSITLLENIYSTGVTHDDHNMTIEMFYSIGHSKLFI